MISNNTAYFYCIIFENSIFHKNLFLNEFLLE